MRLILLAILTTILILTGCKTTEYTFDTVIDKEGNVFRETTFEVHGNEKAVEDVDVDGADVLEDEESWERQPFEPDLVLPTGRKRFSLYESEPGYWHGKWRSDGEVYTDLRYELKVPDSQILPYPKNEVRCAYNEGKVIVRDFVLVKTITYVERFNDFFTKDETRRNLDFATDILAEVFLKTIEKDLGAEYKLHPFNSYVRKEVAPVVKRWNSEVFEIVQEFPSATVGFRDEASDEETETEDDSEEGWERRGETLPDLCGKIAYDMFRLGITKDFDYDISAEEFFDESLVETLEVWTYNKMQELITSKSTGEGISAKVLEDYLDERLSDSLAEQAAAMYGGEEQFEELIGFLLGTFGYRGFPFDGHEFTVSINIPGTLLGISPLPRDVEDVRSLWELPRTPSGKNLITWKFQQGAFYPDGIILAATVVIPDEKNQLRIFKQVVLDTETEKADFAESMIWKKWDELSYSLEILRQCLKEGSTTALTGGDQLDEDEMQDEGFVRDLLELLESEKGTEEEE